MAIRPASTMTMEMTAANTGRSMKKREITGGAPSGLLGGGWGDRRGGRLAGVHRRIRAHLGQALDYHPVTGADAGLNHPAALGGPPGADLAHAPDALPVHHIDEGALRPLGHRALRHGH